MSTKIKDVMTSDVHLISPDCSLQKAAQKMAELDIGALPICDGERLLGMITDRDIALKVAYPDLDPSHIQANEIMNSPIIYCYEDQDVEDVARIMEVKQIRRLVVLNKDKRLTGIVSLGDIAYKTGRESHGRNFG